MRWLRQLDDGARQQSVPLVVDGVMYFSTPPANVFAVNAATGRTIWTYSRPVAGDVPLCCGVVNRGVAISGDLLFLATVDAKLVAIDAATGKPRWEKHVADYRQEYSITAAPLAINDLVFTGVRGAEYPTRGFIAAYRAKDGSPVWRFDTVPRPGEAGNESWDQGSWESGGGSTWMTGSFDPHANLVYWGIGNPAPTYDGTVREGDSLYTDSVVALDAASGRLPWHFQFTPHDVHGWDSAQIPVLFEEPADSGGRKLIAWPNRNGFFYSLDAESGQFIGGRAFVKQTWAKGLAADGRPIVAPDGVPTAKGAYVCPSDTGGTLWWPPALDPEEQVLFVPVLERGSLYFAGTLAKPRAGKPYHGGGVQQARTDFYTAVRALDARTGEMKWEHGFQPRTGKPEMGGLLATAGGLLFGSDGSALVALDSHTGEQLWSFDAGDRVLAPPVAFAVNGQEHIAVLVGNVLLAFSLPGDPAGSSSPRQLPERGNSRIPATARSTGP